MIKKLSLYVAILCLFGCAKTQLVPEKDNFYHGNNEFLQEISQQAIKMDQKNNFSEKLFFNGEVLWDSTIVLTTNISKKLQVLVPIVTSSNGTRKFIEFNMDNSRMTETPSLKTSIQSAIVAQQKLVRPMLSGTSNSKGKSIKDKDQPQLNSLVPGQCSMDVVLRTRYYAGPSGTFDAITYWTDVRNHMYSVLNALSGGDPVQVEITSAGFTVTGSSAAIAIAANQSFYSSNNIGKQHTTNIAVVDFDLVQTPQMSCFEDGGTPPIPPDPKDPKEEEVLCNTDLLANSTIEKNLETVSSEEISNNGVSRTIRDRFKLWSISTWYGKCQFNAPVEVTHFKNEINNKWEMAGIEVGETYEAATIPTAIFTYKNIFPPAVEFAKRTGSVEWRYTITMEIPCTQGILKTILENNGVAQKNYDITD